jgi:hypothetical protein
MYFAVCSYDLTFYPKMHEPYALKKKPALFFTLNFKAHSAFNQDPSPNTQNEI